MEETSSMFVDERVSESRFCFTDIAIERTDTPGQHIPSLDLTELWVFLDHSEEGEGWTLSKASSQRWEMDGEVELTAETEIIECIIKDESGEAIGSVKLRCRDIENGQLQSGSGRSHDLDTCDEQLNLVITWAIIESAPGNWEKGGNETIDDYLDRLNKYGVGFCIQFERSGDLSDIVEAISAIQKAVSLTPEGHHQLPKGLNSLGNAFLSRFERLGEPQDIGEAISALQTSVQLTLENDPDLPARLSNLGNCFMRLFEHTGDLKDIIEAISVQDRAVQLTPEGHVDFPVWLNNLGASYNRRFEHTGDLDDITQAISAQRQAVQFTSPEDDELPCMLSNLGNSLWYRFEKTGELPDIVESISLLQKAVKLTPLDHADLAARLGNLGNSFWSRFKRSGDIADIAEAISSQQRVVHVTPEDHADLHSRIGNLGNMFMSRYGRTGDIEDVAEAIASHRKAVELTPESHTDLHIWLGTLGNANMRLFELTGNIVDINDAITTLHKAVEGSPKEHTHMPSHLNDLGNAFMRRFEDSGNVEDISEAISALESTVKLIPEGNADHPGALNDLGVSFMKRFDKIGELSDINKAISTQQRVVQIAPEGHKELPLWLRNLGNYLVRRSTLTGSSEDLEAAIGLFKSSATCDSGAPLDRLGSAIQWARLLRDHYPLSTDIIPAYDTAIPLLAMTASLEQTVQRRYNHIRDLAGLAPAAASAAFSIGHVEKALEWLEQGRCLVWSQLTSLRTPLDHLRAHDSVLAQEITEVSKALEIAGSSRGLSRIDMSLSEKIKMEDNVKVHLNLARQWDELLARVRSIATFEDFLRPTSVSSILAHLPEHGPIVIINVASDRCDAIGLLPGCDGPLHIPLPCFSHKKASDYRLKLRSKLQGQGLRMRNESQNEDLDRLIRKFRRKAAADKDVVSTILRGLWNEVVKPILESLGFSKADTASPKPLPRVWWCPTGELSFLPIHAAGIYGDRDSESVLDYAVSSYTPSVTALTERVKIQRSVDENLAGLFLTSQPNAPGASRIPGTTKEVQSIYEAAVANRVRALKLEGDAVTVEECLSNMETFSSIHLACHASQNAAEPLQSRFWFHKGSIALSTITERDLQNADLAFLSACQTSTGEEKLSDEAVHLAAGMLAAGYRRVVATMWAIGDRHAPDVANEFYQYLWRRREGDIGGGFDGALSAYALHHSIQQLRARLDDSEQSLLTWVPYVHFGY